jgi:hypothetical protein
MEPSPLPLPGPESRPESGTPWLVYLLFLLASLHCARSIFYVNVSQIDLPRYELGLERMPFQGRIAMLPVLRWSHNNPLLIKGADFLSRNLRKSTDMQQPPEDWTPEKLICLLLGGMSICMMTWTGVWFGRRHLGELWWLPGVVILGILFTTYASRYEMSYWYPYDLPHFAIFGLACALILEESLVPAMLLFAIDTPLRETSIYLVPVTLAVGYAQGRLRPAIAAAAFMAMIWVPVRIWICHVYASNPTDTGIHWGRIVIAIINPLHWPQMASAFGFLAVPLFLGRRYIPRTHRFLILGALPCLFVTLAFGIWQESRIWDEWTVAVGIMAATACVRRLKGDGLTGDLDGEAQAAA